MVLKTIDEVEKKSTAETAEALRLRLEFEREEWRLERAKQQLKCEEVQNTREVAETEAQKSRDLRLA